MSRSRTPRPSLFDLLERGDAGGAAIVSVDRADNCGNGVLSFEKLRRHVTGAAAALRDLGVSERDVTAIVVPNGPELATAFLASAVAGVAAPLNPAYRREEFRFFLDDLSARVLLIAEGVDSPARDIARDRGITIVELGIAAGTAAGVFALNGIVPTSGATMTPSSDAFGLVLHTSGTTARPKMVPLTHGNLVASAEAIAATLRLSRDDRCLNVMPLFHIHGLVASVLASLSAGGSVVCAPDLIAPHFFRWLDESTPSWYSAVPTMHQAILSRARDAENETIIQRSRLRFVRSSSAALPRHVFDELESTLRVPVIEAYGMTEAAHQMASNPLPPLERKAGTVGPAAGPEIAIAGRDGHHLAVGETGEVLIRGSGVTQGYLNNPDANARAMVDGWFRTGDQGVLDADGYLTLTGRLKELINRGGEKIAPLEVDRVLMDHPAVESALCFAVPHTLLGEEIEAAVVLRPACIASERELRDYAASRLAYFKVPKRIVIVDVIPAGPTGKPQRTGLADRLARTGPAARSAMIDDSDGTPPRTPLEEKIASAWNEIMGAPVPGMRRDLLTLGADSIVAIRLVARLRALLEVDVPLEAFFDSPSVEGLAAVVEGLRVSGVAPSSVPGRRGDSAPTPLSTAQLSLWLFGQVHAEGAANAAPKRLRLHGPVDRDALRRTLTEIVRRHEMLRTTIATRDGVPLQVVNPPVAVELPEVDARLWPAADRDNSVAALLDSEACRSFDLARDLLLRPLLVRTAEKDYELQLTSHLVAFDGWSNGILLRELGVLYSAFAAGQGSPLSEPPLQYADFAAWEHARQRASQHEADREFWTAHITGSSSSVDVPTDRARPRARGIHLRLATDEIDAATTRRLAGLAREERTTVFAAAFAAFQVLVGRRAGNDDFVLGAVFANRPHVDTESIIGSFQTVLPIRARLADAPSFRVHLQRTGSVLAQAFAHQVFPVEQLAPQLKAGDSSAAASMFQVVFNYRNMPMALPAMGGIEVSNFRAPHLTSAFDLLLNVTPMDGGLSLELEYDPDLFDAETAERWLGGYRAMIDGVVANPEASTARLPIMPTSEFRLLEEDWSGAAVPAPRTELVIDRFERAASANPAAIAIEDAGVGVSYLDLRQRVHRAARHLVSAGAEHGARVGLSVNRSADAIAALLAIFRIGAVYVPLDPLTPKHRLGVMLNTAGLQFIVTDGRDNPELTGRPETMVDLQDLLQDESSSSLASRPRAQADDPAYVIFTSGSSGIPKGVEIAHGALSRYLAATEASYIVRPGDRFLEFASLSFDSSLEEMLNPLCAGATVVIRTDEMLDSPAIFADRCRSLRLTHLSLPTAFWHELVAADWPEDLDLGPDLRVLLVGGEAMSSDAFRRWKRVTRPGIDLINGYGPTEVTIAATYVVLSRDEERDAGIPIGCPFPGYTVFVRDARGEPLPIGAAGELWVGGPNLALGYLGDPQLTASRFVTDVATGGTGARFYRTGDRVRWRGDGRLAFLGRTDLQLKVRGYRIEPADIERVLQEVAGVRQVAVIAQRGPGGDRLVAFVVPEGVAAVEMKVLTDAATRELPAYMVPSQFVMLARLPISSTGKVDRAALAALVPGQAVMAGGTITTPTEQAVVRIWESQFGISGIGADDSFFALGGHSLLAMRMVDRLRVELSIDVTIRTILMHPTVASLARELDRIGEAAGPESTAEPIPRAPRVPRPAPRDGL